MQHVYSCLGGGEEYDSCLVYHVISHVSPSYLTAVVKPISVPFGFIAISDDLTSLHI